MSLRQDQLAAALRKNVGVAKASMGAATRQIPARPLRIDDLPRQVGMSTSTFHNHFRAVTPLSPLQYQKQLRLREVRRLMLAEQIDAATAAFNVGYESPSPFSREYSRFFGAPTLRDVANLCLMASGDVA